MSMTAIETDEMSEVLDRVRTWPAPSRIAVVMRILESLEPEFAATPKNIPTAEEIHRQFQTDKPAPDDETIRRWKDEHIMEKYG